MALLWIEGFESYGDYVGENVVDVMLDKYDLYGSSRYLQDGRTGGFSMKGSLALDYNTTPTLTSDDTLIIGFAIKPILNYDDIVCLQLWDFDEYGINLKYSLTTGEISVYRGSSTLLGTTTSAGITLDVWSYVELLVTCDNSAGVVQLRVNEVEKLNLSGIDTNPGPFNYHDRVNIVTSTRYVIDDVYVCDSTGSLNNTFLGIRQVAVMFPTADTAQADWTPSTGSDNYALIDEQAIDTGDYIDGGPGDYDLYEYGTLSDLGVINGIQINTNIREMSSEYVTYYNPIKSGGSTYDGVGIPVQANTMIMKRNIVETDPYTGSLWTLTGLNDAEFGIKV